MRIHQELQTSITTTRHKTTALLYISIYFDVLIPDVHMVQLQVFEDTADTNNKPYEASKHLHRHSTTKIRGETMQEDTALTTTSLRGWLHGMARSSLNTPLATDYAQPRNSFLKAPPLDAVDTLYLLYKV